MKKLIAIFFIMILFSCNKGEILYVENQNVDFKFCKLKNNSSSKAIQFTIKKISTSTYDKSFNYYQLMPGEEIELEKTNKYGQYLFNYEIVGELEMQPNELIKRNAWY